MTGLPGDVPASTEKEAGRYLYYGLLLYVVLFYSQIGARFPFLVPLHLELVVGATLTFVSVVRIVSGKVDLKGRQLNIAILLLFGFVVCTMPLAFVKIRALEAFLRVIKCFAVYLMVVSSIDTEKRLKGFVYVYLAMLALVFVQPFLQSLSGEGFVYNNYMMRLRGVTGYFAHPNQLGMVASTSLPFSLYLGMQTKSRILKLACLGLIGIALRVVMLTQSRTALLGVLAFGFTVWVLSKKKGVTTVVGIVCVAVIWGFTPQETKDRYLTLLDAPRVISEGRESFRNDEEARALTSMASRLELARQSLEFFMERPLIGIGFGCYTSYAGRKTGSWFPPHNTYLQMLAEMGIIGTSLFAWVVFLTIRNLLESRRMFRKMKEEGTFLFAVGSAVLTYYVTYLTVSLFGIELYANFWWLAAGLSVVLLRVGEKQSSEVRAEVASG